MLTRRKRMLLRKRKIAVLAAAYQHIFASTSILTLPSDRRWWVRPLFCRRDTFGAYKQVFLFMKSSDEEKFFNYCRMTPRTFDILLEMLHSRLEKQTLIREPVCPGERLAITLRYLASGDSMASISYAYLVAANTVSRIIFETCNILWDIVGPKVLPKNLGPSEWKEKADGFNRQWNFPHCLSAIDGKHVVMQAPRNCGSSFYNYKQVHSVVLMAGADAYYKYLFVDIGGAGRQSDGGTFANSNFGRCLMNRSLNLPCPQTIARDSATLPYVFVADEAFPLRENIMRPFPGEKGRLPLIKAVFNFRLSRARRIIENVFGITAARWRILRKPIIASLNTVEAIIKAVVVLHNFCQEESNLQNNRYCPKNFVDVELDDGTFQDGRWREEGLGAGLVPLRNISSNRNSQAARNVRDMFANYFIEDGQIDKQWSHI